MARRPPPPALDDAPLAPGLYVVATPIGNLRDITLRALDVLAAADLVLAEYTRVAGKLLSAYGLSAKLERYDEHGAERARPRALAALAAMAAVLGSREAVVCRELTKLSETIVRGPLPDLAADPRFAAPKGELVILVGPGQAAEASATDVDTALADALERLRPAEAAAEVARALGLSRREVYQRAMALRAGR